MAEHERSGIKMMTMKTVLAVCIASENREVSFWQDFLAASFGYAQQLGSRLTVAAGAGVRDPEGDDFIDLCRAADDLYLAAAPAAAPEDPEASVAWALEVAREAGASLIFLPHSVTNVQIAARLAYRFNAGLVTDCLSVKIAGGELAGMVRPVYGSKVLANFTGEYPVVVTLRGGRQAVLMPPEKNSPPVVKRITRPAVEEKVRLIEKRFLSGEGEVNLAGARVVIGIGRGVGGPDGVELVKDQARKIGAAIGVSKAVVDAGWASTASLIGLSGKKINPQIYIAVGISGSIQHMTGVSGARAVVAINTDREAPIMENCDLALVGEYGKILPELVSRLAGPATHS